MIERRFFFKLFNHTFVQALCVIFVQYIIYFPLNSLYYNFYHSPNNVSIPFELKSAIAWDSSRFFHVAFLQSTIFPATPAILETFDKSRQDVTLSYCYYTMCVREWLHYLFIGERRAASRRIERCGTRYSQTSSERCLVAT